MVASARYALPLAALLLFLAKSPGADDGLSRVEISKIGKAGTALVELKARRSYGSAFCIHPSGLFLTNEHVAQGDVTLILNPGQKNEKTYPAKVVRSDKELDLALLRVEGGKELPALALGSDENLTELMEVVAFGFPFGQNLALDRKEYPAVSVNVGSITSLRRKDDRLHRIQLDAAVNPGNSGGPVLDKNGKVVGVVVSGVPGSGVNFAIPVSAVTGFVARPDIQFQPPTLHAADVHKATDFEAEVLPILPNAAPISVELVLKPTKGAEQRLRMEGKDGKYRATAVPLPPPDGPAAQRLVAQFDNSLLNATVLDRTFKVGDRELKLSQVRGVQLLPTPHVVLHDGKEVEGAVTGLDAVPVRLGEQSVSVDLGKAKTLRLAPAVPNVVWCTLVVRQGDKEILRHGQSITVQGLLAAPAAGVLEGTVKAPKLDGDKVVRKLASPVSDVAVGGGGRYLVLHLAKTRQLAVFDVNKADLVCHIPVGEDNVKFAAGMEDLVIVLPGARTIERWSLTTFERDVAAALPVKGAIKGIALGSASKGPLLVHTAAGTEPLSPASFVFVNLETMKLLEGELKTQQIGAWYRDLVHIRAAANGRAFGLWCTSHTPSGMGTLVLSQVDVKSYYMHSSVGHVLPSADGKSILTAFGRYTPQVKITDRQQAPEVLIPAHHGDYYLTLPPVGKGGAATVRSLSSPKPIATLDDFDLSVPKEDFVKHDFTFDKRVHLIPEAKLVITIPASDDQLVLRRYKE